MRHLPNLMTFSRLFLAIPLGIWVWLYWPMDDYLTSILVLAFALTDWVDGALARALNARSDFGAWLDPIADKALIFCLGLAMANATNWAIWWFLPFIVISARDGMMIFMRNSKKVAQKLPVSPLAKFKTWLTMAGLVIVMLPLSWDVFFMGLWVYWVSAVLSTWSAYQYLRKI